MFNAMPDQLQLHCGQVRQGPGVLPGLQEIETTDRSAGS